MSDDWYDSVGKYERQEESFEKEEQMKLKTRDNPRATIVVATLILICAGAFFLGVYKMVQSFTSQECAITVQMNGSKATYIGKTI